MEMKTAFLNSFVEEEIYKDQPKGFTSVGRVEVIWGYDFIKNESDPCVYKTIRGSTVAYLVLYLDDILLICNDVKMLGDIKASLSTQFFMNHMGQASYILGIKIYRDRSRKMLGLTQSSYIENVLKRFKMQNSKWGFLRMMHGIKLSEKQFSKTNEELKRMSDIPYTFAVEAFNMLSSTPGRYCAHFECDKELVLKGYSDASFQSDNDDAKSQLDFVFKLNGGVVA
ncbi:UNVERIFIED_CONTAM: hypothetical protein Sangu_1562100 [Sesamum angustifolium]|uniref:Reverse transcriptase Ty1/copia-type domain-containing protein n=1 Tax=Sesamum angustifolium TaxID=2727405 RepID=A0AAW2MTF1_9LAMI